MCIMFCQGVCQLQESDDDEEEYLHRRIDIRYLSYYFQLLELMQLIGPLSELLKRWREADFNILICYFFLSPICS